MNELPLTDQQIEGEIQRKNLVRPRVTTHTINDAIGNVRYEHPAGTTLTFCILELKNGFTVTGESACVSAENFDAKLGQQIAYQNAHDKCWQLLGFALATRLSGYEFEFETVAEKADA